MGEKVTAFFNKWLELIQTASRTSSNNFHSPETPIATSSNANAAPVAESSQPSGSIGGSLKKTRNDSATPVTPSRRTVFLSEWWLDVVRDERDGKCLAVGGKTYTRLGVRRIFTSGPISKRIDAYTVETGDGFIVILDGLINKYRTKSNGLCAQASSDFLMGFPCNWESYASDYFAKATSPERHHASNSADLFHKANISCPPPISRDGSPATKLLSFIKLAEYDCYNLSRNIIHEEQGVKSHGLEVPADPNCRDTRKCNSSLNQLVKQEKLSNRKKKEPFLNQEGFMQDDTMKIEQDSDVDKSKVHFFLRRRSPRFLKVENFESQTKNIRKKKIKTELETLPLTTISVPSISNIQTKEVKEVKEEPYTPCVKHGPFTRETVTPLFLSPESLNLKRSRSGRVLLPRLEVHQTVVYDADGTVTGIMDTRPSEGSISFTESKSASSRKIRNVRPKK